MTAFVVEKEPEVEEQPGLRIPGKLEQARLQGRRDDRAPLRRLPDARRERPRRRERASARASTSSWAGIELGRVNIAARAVGIATRAFEEAIRYAQQREAFGKPIAQHQAIQLKLAQMATKIEAARLLTLQAAERKSAGERADLEAGMAKLFATETAQEVALEAMRIHGGYGYSQEFVVERLYRDAPLLILGEGSNEIQQLVIARRLLERYPL